MPTYDMGTAHGRIRVDFEGDGFRQAEQGFNRSTEAADRSDSSFSRTGKTLSRMVSGMADAAKTVARVGLQIGAVASTAVSLAPLIVAAGAAVAQFVQATLAAAPALIAFAAAGLFVKATFAQIFKEGSAARKAIQPLADGFTKAGEAASNAAARGIKPLVEQLSKAIMPQVRSTMVDIGKATNQVQKEFFNWAKSADGVKSIQGFLRPIGTSIRELGPHVSALAISFVRLLGRITGVSLAAGTSGLANVLDAVAKKLDTINAATVSEGIEKLKNTFTTIVSAGQTVVGWIRKVVEAYKLYTTEFRAVADAVSILAIAFGGPFVAIVAAIGLVIRHFDQFKAGWESLKNSLSAPAGTGIFGGIKEELPKLQQMVSGLKANFKSFIGDVLPPLKKAFDDIVQTVGPRLEEIYQKVTTKLIPAFGQFVEAMGPIVAFFIGVLGPVIASTFGNVLRIISGAIDIITGIFQVFTALIKDDWSLAWTGIKNILSGIWQIIVAIVRQFWSNLQGLFNLGIGVITAIWRKLFDIVRSVATQGLSNAKSVFGGFFSGIGSAFKTGVGIVKSVWSAGMNHVKSVASTSMNAAKSAVGTAVGGIVSFHRALPGRVASALSSFASTVRGIASRAMSGFKSAVSSGINGVIAFHKRIPGMIRSALGNTRSLLVNAGLNIINGLLDGIRSAIGRVKDLLGSITGLIPDWKGPMKTDKKLLTPNGKKIMQSLMIGIAKQLPALRKMLGGVTTQTIQTGVTQRLSGAGGGLEFRSAPMVVQKNVPPDWNAISRVLAAELRRAGLGAVHIDGKLISDVISRETGRRTAQARRTR